MTFSTLELFQRWAFFYFFNIYPIFLKLNFPDFELFQLWITQILSSSDFELFQLFSLLTLNISSFELSQHWAFIPFWYFFTISLILNFSNFEFFSNFIAVEMGIIRKVNNKWVSERSCHFCKIFEYNGSDKIKNVDRNSIVRICLKLQKRKFIFVDMSWHFYGVFLKTSAEFLHWGLHNYIFNICMLCWSAFETISGPFLPKRSDYVLGPPLKNFDNYLKTPTQLFGSFEVENKKIKIKIISVTNTIFKVWIMKNRKLPHFLCINSL